MDDVTALRMLMENATEYFKNLGPESTERMAEEFDFNEYLHFMELVDKFGQETRVGLPNLYSSNERIFVGWKVGLVKWKPMILSMTHEERKNPDLLTVDESRSTRVRRIAKVSGTTYEGVTRLTAEFEKFRDAMPFAERDNDESNNTTTVDENPSTMTMDNRALRSGGKKRKKKKKGSRRGGARASS